MDALYVRLHRQARRRRLLIAVLRWAPVVFCTAAVFGVAVFMDLHPHAH